MGRLLGPHPGASFTAYAANGRMDEDFIGQTPKEVTEMFLIKV
jgi:hypothetical protein